MRTSIWLNLDMSMMIFEFLLSKFAPTWENQSSGKLQTNRGAWEGSRTAVHIRLSVDHPGAATVLSLELSLLLFHHLFQFLRGHNVHSCIYLIQNIGVTDVESTLNEGNYKRMMYVRLNFYPFIFRFLVQKKGQNIK